MMSRAIIFVALFCNAFAQQPPDGTHIGEMFLYETTPASGANYIDVNLFFVPVAGSSAISQVQIQDAENDASCTFAYSSLSLFNPPDTRTLALRINTNTAEFTEQTSSPAGVSSCDVTGTKATGEFTFYIITRAIADTISAEDMIFTINPTGSDGQQFNEGTLLNPGQDSVIPVNLATYTFSLGVEDENGNIVTNLDLGDSFKLRFTMTIDPYEVNMEYACATLSNCITDVDNTFTNKPRTMIDTNGCRSGTFLTLNQPATYGFSKLDSSSPAGSTLTYIAKTPLTETKGYFQGQLDPSSNNELHFRCELDPAYDGTSTADGTCGGNHCNPSGRKRRASEDDSTTVTASVSVTSDKQEDEDDCDCPDSLTLYSSFGVLGVTAAICFVAMVLTFINVHQSTSSGRKLQM